MSTAQTVYVVSVRDSLGMDVDKVFATLPASRSYLRRKYNITEMKQQADTKLWRGEAAGVAAEIHKRSVFQGAKWA